MPLRNAPIRRKLMTIIMLTSGVVLLLTCAAYFAYEILTFRQTTVRQLATLSQVVGSNSTAALAFENQDDAKEILAALKAEPHIVSAGLYDAQGKLFSSYPAAPAAGAFPAAPEPDGYRFEDSHLVAFQPVVQGNRRLGTLYLKSDLGAMNERLRLHGLIVFLVITGSFGVAYLLSRTLQRQISAPILALTDTARAISDRRDYSVRAVKRGEDELGLLTDAFNQMLARIDEQNRALSESEARYRVMVERSPDAIIVQCDGVILQANPAAAGLLRAPSAEALAGKPVLEILPPEDREAVQQRLDLIAAGAEIPTIRERSLLRLDGTPVEVEVALAFLSHGGRPATQAFIRDITERRLTDTALRVRTEELARSNTELERFAYVASHDLQEPLRMVASYLQLLQRRYRDKLDAEADEFIAFAVDGAGRMKGLINDLLTFSRVGTQGKPPEPVTVESALKSALANLKMAIADSRAEVSHDPLPVVLGDEAQLVQLLQNLIGNAVKFHGAEAPRVHVGARREKAEWHFTVRDNGIGIDPQFFDRVFIIFQRLHGREEFPGTGIGLALCKKIVERHGGRIWIESSPGKGAAFHFTLPTAPDSPHAAQ